MNVLVNQLGYECGDRPSIVLRGDASDDPGTVAVIAAGRHEVMATATPERVGPVADWRDWIFWTVDLPPLGEPGEYEAIVTADDAVDGSGPSGDCLARSRRFRVGEDLLHREVVPDVLSYFRVERCTGRYDRADRRATFHDDREDAVDVRGGWYDASGDVSKYLSHLHYATYWNPQQIPLVAWTLCDAHERFADEPQTEDGAATRSAALASAAREEALYGADFLVRAQDEAGYFYTTVFDGWSGDPEEREICAFEGFEGERTDDYRAGMRQGGGVAVAALSRASVLAGAQSDGVSDATFDAETYLTTAIDGFDHLRENNEAYLDDGTENLLDDYCGLLAATELARATGEERFAVAAADRARSLLDRQAGDGWFAADDAGDRPFFHATDEGLPVVALCRFATVFGRDDAAGDDPSGAPPATPPALPEPSLLDDVRAAVHDYWAFECDLTAAVTNPFGYARQYATAVDESEPTGRFFLPHDNETGYWWLGENARICSLAGAALHTVETLSISEEAGDRTAGVAVGAGRLRSFAADQLDWILGRNPYDLSMLEGVGENPPPFVPDAPQTPGGIVNGVTAGVDDESDVAFLPAEYADDYAYTWRWSEQWLPHAAWFLFAAVRANDDTRSAGRE